MKLSCDIVQDLLPLYEDEVCSPGSRAAVEAHLQTCESCREYRESVKKMPEVDTVSDGPEEKKRAKRLFHRLQLRWVLSAIAILLVCMLVNNQITGQGLALDNWDDIYYAKKFAGHLEKGELEAAAEMLDFSDSYDRALMCLSWDREFYERSYEPMEIGGEIWYFSEGTVNNFDEDKEYTELMIWEELIFDWGAVIPMDVWNDYVENHAEKATTYGKGVKITRRNWFDNIYSDEESGLFYPVETPWGDFMLRDYAWGYLEHSDKTLADYGCFFYNMPEEMYLDVKGALDVYAEERYQLIQDTYGYAADMTLEEYSAYHRQLYLEGLEELYAQGYTVETGAVKNLSSPSNDPSRLVRLDADLMKDGEVFLSFPLRIDVVDGKVVLVNCSSDDPYESHELLQPFEMD